MPAKVSRPMVCAFCGGERDGAPTAGAYLEVEVTNPTATGGQRQLLGAHEQCLAEALAPGFCIEVDLLVDPPSATGAPTAS